MSVHATTVNKVCLSGLNTIYLADLMIRAGEAEVDRRGRHGVDDRRAIPAPGRSRRLSDRRREARRLDDVRRAHLRLRPLRDGTVDRGAQQGSRLARAPGRLQAASHERAAAAAKNGQFAEEIVPVEVPQRKGDPIVVDSDEGIRPGTTAESLGALRPAFTKDGTITAGNASQISDGGAAVVVMSKERAAAAGLTPLGELVGYGQVAGPDASLLSQPSNAIKQATAKAGIGIGDLDLVEINEAFAAVGLAPRTSSASTSRSST